MNPSNPNACEEALMAVEPKAGLVRKRSKSKERNPENSRSPQQDAGSGADSGTADAPPGERVVVKIRSKSKQKPPSKPRADGTSEIETPKEVEVVIHTRSIAIDARKNVNLVKDIDKILGDGSYAEKIASGQLQLPSPDFKARSKSKEVNPKK